MSDPGERRDFGAYERDYADHHFEVVQARLRKRMLLELLDREQPRAILEVGCGSDTIANHWTSADLFTVVEPGAGFAAKARDDLAGRVGADVVECLLEDAVEALSGRSFDLILLSGLLPEVPDCGGLLRTTRSLCGPHTVVHVNVANAHSVHRLLGLEMGAIGDIHELSATQQKLQQYRTFSLESLKALMAAEGFDAFDSGGYFVKPFTHGQMQWLQDAGFLTDAMLEGLWGLAKHMPEHGSEIFVNARKSA